MRRLIPCLLGLLLLPLFVGAAFAWQPEGAWRAARGDAGERVVAAAVTGGDGAIYAVGAGLVERRVPGGHFEPAGRYAPDLRWDEDQGIDAIGPFEPDFLNRVADEAFRAIEASGAQELSGDSTSEDVAGLLLRTYMEEPEPGSDSPYRVVALVPAEGGAWLATGAGLFRLTAEGVGGPIGPQLTINDLAHARGVLWLATTDGLYTVGGDARFVRRLAGPISRVAAFTGAVTYLADGELWRWADGGEPVRVAPPTGRAEQIAADAKGLWVSTSMALYRQEGGEWRLCPAIADTLSALTPAADGGLLATGERGVYVVDADCTKVARIDPPWPGGAQLFGVTEQGDELWLATADGLHTLAPRDHNSADSARVDAFRRAVRELPSLDALTRSALEYNKLDRAATAYGFRPVLRGLLPDLRITYRTAGRRAVAQPTVFGGDPQATINPWRPQWTVMLTWTIRFDILTTVFNVERDSSVAAVQGGDFGDEDTGQVDDGDPTDVSTNLASASADADYAATEFDDSGTSATFNSADYDPYGSGADSFGGTSTPGIDTVTDDRAFALLAVERRQAQRDRMLLSDRLARLYRERVQLMFKLWVELPIDGLYLAEVMRIDEIDADFNAATGGAFSRALPR